MHALESLLDSRCTAIQAAGEAQIVDSSAFHVWRHGTGPHSALRLAASTWLERCRDHVPVLRGTSRSRTQHLRAWRLRLRACHSVCRG